MSSEEAASQQGNGCRGDTLVRINYTFLGRSKTMSHMTGGEEEGMAQPVQPREQE